MTNEQQLPMMKNMLRTAEQVGIPLDLFYCYILNDIKEVGVYLTESFNKLQVKKMELMYNNLEEDTEVMWVDNDIIFFQNCIDDILKYKEGMVFQDDGWSMCTGFFLLRNNSKKHVYIKHLIKESIYYIIERDYKINEQNAFKDLLINKQNKYRLLPSDEYPNGNVYFNRNNRTKAKMLHNNCIVGTEAKVERFKEYNMWEPVFDLSKVKTIYI
jgi:hypothetical protein